MARIVTPPRPAPYQASLLHKVVSLTVALLILAVAIWGFWIGMVEPQVERVRDLLK